MVSRKLARACLTVDGEQFDAGLNENSIKFEHLYLPFYFSSTLPKLISKVYCVVNHKDTEGRSVKHRRGTLLLPGQPHTNMRLGECLIIRRCNVHINLPWLVVVVRVSFECVFSSLPNELCLTPLTQRS